MAVRQCHIQIAPYRPQDKHNVGLRFSARLRSCAISCIRQRNICNVGLIAVKNQRFAYVKLFELHVKIERTFHYVSISLH